MDQIRTGEFIAAIRREKGLSQRELADLLAISDKTVSKWETGRGLPDVSLMLPLCDALGITVNELLSGERLSDSSYKAKAEENIMNMMNERKENRTKFRLTIVTGIISVVTFVTLLLVVVFYTDVISLPVRLVLIGVACAVFAAGIGVAMWGEMRVGYYECRECGTKFNPGAAQYMIAPHMLTTRLLKCPHCGKRSWCRKVMAKEE